MLLVLVALVALVKPVVLAEGEEASSADKANNPRLAATGEIPIMASKVLVGGN